MTKNKNKMMKKNKEDYAIMLFMPAQIYDVSILADPCPLPETIKKRSLNQKERLIYAPFSGVGGIIYDKDSVYVNIVGREKRKGNNVSGIQYT